MSSLHTRTRSAAIFFAIFLPVALSVAAAWAFGGRDEEDSKPGLKSLVSEWGAITAPVFDQAESTPGYADTGADLFAGPQKFPAERNYFAGVLPNGRIVKPAGKSAQIGTNPLGAVLTSDGKYLITSNDDEREEGFSSYQSKENLGGYSLSVVDTASLRVVSHLRIGKLFIGLQVTGAGPYTVWASGGADNDVKMVTISDQGLIQKGPISIPIPAKTPSDQGFVSNYKLDLKSSPTGFTPGGIRSTFPAGSALSPDGRFLYVACNGDNSLAVIDTKKAAASLRGTVVAQIPVGYFPYTVAVSPDGSKVAVSNWGITQYEFAKAQYEGGRLTSLDPVIPDFVVPDTNTEGTNPKTSSVSMLAVPGGDGSKISAQKAIYQGHKLDMLENVGDTHPSAIAMVARGQEQVLYVTRSNSDKLGIINLGTDEAAGEIDLTPFFHGESEGLNLSGAYPNAIAVSRDGLRMYVAEAGINSIAVLDTSAPLKPRLLGRIPTGWYPTAVAVSPDGKVLYVTNAKGIGEDINPQIRGPQSAPLLRTPGAEARPDGGKTPPPTRLASDSRVDSNYVFGTVQRIELSAASLRLDDHKVESYNFAYHPPKDTSVVPIGGGPSKKITHVFFILHENKTFDSMLGNQTDHFGNFASTTFNDVDGNPYSNRQYTGVSLNTQALATKLATAVNYYSDSEESDAGHQFAASGTSSDYTQKTLLVKDGRGLLVNKNFEPEDYPEHGYIFNNAARHGVSFKDYGALIRIVGTDTGESEPATINDPGSGKLGYPAVDCSGDPSPQCNLSKPLRTVGDVTSPVSGFGQSYFLKMPVLAVLGTKNDNGEDRLDHNYPGYNFNISDQRRALEFIHDFDRMVDKGTLPQFVYIYQPNDHTGGVHARNRGKDNGVINLPQQQVADGDVAFGMVVQHLMKSPVYYDPKTGEGSAIFFTWDDAQSTRDHIHPHRTPLLVISPYAKPGHIAKHHYSTASIVKTEELLLGLPPNNLGDLLATDLREMFQPEYNHITAADIDFTTTVAAAGSPESKRIWALSARLDTSGPDRDSYRLGALANLSLDADELYKAAQEKHTLRSASYRARQAQLYKEAMRVVSGPARREDDD